ncbi:hypothetical protein [Chamaesiphon sp. OTE_8_metabat_110]|uniref:hypothetical protein n=1 Tax=Chamaesiphon sp. OTE_8_metabat_110 TaxID=2964696 RepID=UPI00286C4E18|nr:hypothetical protein [Chamaesiphon sp. OTE_8_metabat_110]
MPIQFTCEKLLLSPSSFELLERPDPIGVAVVKRLKSIDFNSVTHLLSPVECYSCTQATFSFGSSPENVAWEDSPTKLAPLSDACTIAYLATLPIQIYENLLAIEQICVGMDRSSIVDGLVKTSAVSVLPAIRRSDLIAGNKEIEPYHRIDRDLETYCVPYGILIKRWRGKNAYWYWQYYRADGSRADDYMHKTLDGAIARVKAIGIPADASPQRLNKSKKVWHLN